MGFYENWDASHTGALAYRKMCKVTSLQTTFFNLHELSVHGSTYLDISNILRLFEEIVSDAHILKKTARFPDDGLYFDSNHKYLSKVIRELKGILHEELKFSNFIKTKFRNERIVDLTEDTILYLSANPEIQLLREFYTRQSYEAKYNIVWKDYDPSPTLAQSLLSKVNMETARSSEEPQPGTSQSQGMSERRIGSCMQTSIQHAPASTSPFAAPQLATENLPLTSFSKRLVGLHSGATVITQPEASERPVTVPVRPPHEYNQSLFKIPEVPPKKRLSTHSSTSYVPLDSAKTLNPTPSSNLPKFSDSFSSGALQPDSASSSSTSYDSALDLTYCPILNTFVQVTSSTSLNSSTPLSSATSFNSSLPSSSSTSFNSFVSSNPSASSNSSLPLSSSTSSNSYISLNTPTSCNSSEHLSSSTSSNYAQPLSSSTSFNSYVPLSSSTSCISSVPLSSSTSSNSSLPLSSSTSFNSYVPLSSPTSSNSSVPLSSCASFNSSAPLNSSASFDSSVTFSPTLNAFVPTNSIASSNSYVPSNSVTFPDSIAPSSSSRSSNSSKPFKFSTPPCPYVFVGFNRRSSSSASLNSSTSVNPAASSNSSLYLSPPTTSTSLNPTTTSASLNPPTPSTSFASPSISSNAPTPSSSLNTSTPSTSLNTSTPSTSTNTTLTSTLPQTSLLLQSPTPTTSPTMSHNFPIPSTSTASHKNKVKPSEPTVLTSPKRKTSAESGDTQEPESRKSARDTLCLIKFLKLGFHSKSGQNGKTKNQKCD